MACIYGYGRISTLCHTGTHHVVFIFQKVNLQNSSITQNKINSNSTLMHQINQSLRLRSSIATHKFQVQSKFLVRTVISKLGSKLNLNMCRELLSSFPSMRIYFRVLLNEQKLWSYTLVYLFHTLNLYKLYFYLVFIFISTLNNMRMKDVCI